MCCTLICPRSEIYRRQNTSFKRSNLSPFRIDEVAYYMTVLESQAREQARLKKFCLLRDGGRCLVTGRYDANDERFFPWPQNASTAYTQAAHILPYALGNFNEKDSIQLTQKATIWDAITRMFSDVSSRLNFNGNRVNELCNVLTIYDSLHTAFGAFAFCLTPTEEENTLQNRNISKISDCLLGWTASQSNCDICYYRFKGWSYQARIYYRCTPRLRMFCMQLA